MKTCSRPELSGTESGSILLGVDHEAGSILFGLDHESGSILLGVNHEAGSILFGVDHESGSASTWNGSNAMIEAIHETFNDSYYILHLTRRSLLFSGCVS